MTSEFESYPQLPWNSATAVDDARDLLSNAQSEDDAAHAQQAMFNALGNNHAGTYYPIALAVVAHLGLQVELGSLWAQYAAVQTLLDLTGSFEPENGYEAFAPSEQEPAAHVQSELRRQVRGLASKLRTVAVHDRPASLGAAELIELVAGEA